MRKATRQFLESNLQQLERRREYVEHEVTDLEGTLARAREERNYLEEQIDEIRKDLEEADRADDAKQGFTMVTYE